MPGPKPQPHKPYSKYRAKPGGKLVTLPVECTLPAPALPPGRKWTAAERRLWRDLWASPQATQWDDSYAMAVAMLVAHTSAVLGGTASAWQAAEARQLADRLGLTPTGLAALGWQLAEDTAAAPLAVLPGGAR